VRLVYTDSPAPTDPAELALPTTATEPSFRAKLEAELKITTTMVAAQESFNSRKHHPNTGLGEVAKQKLGLPQVLFPQRKSPPESSSKGISYRKIGLTVHQ